MVNGYNGVLSTVNSCLNNPALKTSVYTNQQDKVCLRIKRPETDKLRQNDRGSVNIGIFKRNLGLKDGVIGSNNDSYSATDRAQWSDSSTLERGASISVPLTELGQEPYLFGPHKNKELKDNVQEALKSQSRTQ